VQGFSALPLLPLACILASDFYKQDASLRVEPWLPDSRGPSEQYSGLPAYHKFFGNPLCDSTTQLLQIGIALQAYTPIIPQFQLNVLNLSFPAIKSQCDNFFNIQHGFFSSGNKKDFIAVNFNPMIFD
jgi:hypothetical protein